MLSLPQLTLKRMPFVRLLLFLTAGILIEFYCKIPIKYLIIAALVLIIATCIFNLLSFTQKYFLRWLNGIFILALFSFSGAIITYHNNIENNSQSIGNIYRNGNLIEFTLTEPLVEKPKSYKATAIANAVLSGNSWQKVDKKILIYFKKDSIAASLDEGSQIICKANLQDIKNEGNPGEFDFKQYCLFHAMQQQVYLSPSHYIILPGKNTSFLKNI